MSFSFGTPSSAPATSGLTSGFSFGAAKPATPGFGLGSTPPSSGGLFGTPASSAPAFGSTTTPAFGATSTPGFGSTTTPAFGATSTPTFGAAAPSFGTTPAFGATSASSFGATSTPSFGATTTPAFGTTTTQSFGAGLGTGGLNFGATSTGQTGLSFGAPASKGLTGTFPQTNTLFGGAGTSKLGITTLGGTQPASSVAPSLGLGGSSTSAGLGVTNTTQSGDGKSEPPKQMKLPNEISTMVDTFKEFVKKQKSLSSDVMRVSIKPLNNVSRQVDSLLHGAASLASSVSRARAHSRRLRGAGADALAAADAAQRQAQGLAYSEEGAALPRFVKELIAELEQQLITLRRQMDEADKQMQAAPKLLSEQELTLGIRRMHESLVALAGRLQGVHSQVEAQKEQYLNLRRYVLKDPTNVFDTQSNSTSLEQILRDAESGRKKTGFADSFNSTVLSDPRTALGNIQQLAGPTPFSYMGSTVPAHNPADTSGSAWQPQPSLSSSFPAPSFGFGEASGFQLQKPPGKRTKQ